jgi:uncharacterized coiled-coil DUF342 family protein
MLNCFLVIDNKSNKMSSHLPRLSEEMKNEKQEKERLQCELKQMVEKYSVLLQRLLERCDQLVQERDQLVQERDQLVQERDQLVQERDQLVQERDQCFHEKEFSKKRTSYQCSPAMATCDGLYNPPM